MAGDGRILGYFGDACLLGPDDFGLGRDELLGGGVALGGELSLFLLDFRELIKSLVREFLTRWKGSPVVEGQESYRQLSAAIQQLGAFYQANGQRSRLSSGSRKARRRLQQQGSAPQARPPATHTHE